MTRRSGQSARRYLTGRRSFSWQEFVGPRRRLAQPTAIGYLRFVPRRSGQSARLYLTGKRSFSWQEFVGPRRRLAQPTGFIAPSVRWASKPLGRANRPDAIYPLSVPCGGKNVLGRADAWRKCRSWFELISGNNISLLAAASHTLLWVDFRAFTREGIAMSGLSIAVRGRVNTCSMAVRLNRVTELLLSCLLRVRFLSLGTCI